MKKSIIMLLLFVFGIQFTSQSQSANFNNSIWSTLSKVTYKIGRDDYGELYIPVFSEDIKKLAGKEVVIPGYIIPFDGMFKPDHIIISSLPLSECFFCGSGGPETVMDVFLKEPIKYTSNPIKVRGILTLNDKDPDNMMYILKDAKFDGLAF
jgi:hypothetical protein